MFVSYAQNFEDVLLWRALQHVGTGFYIDVGAAHPDIDSVTRAFYDRGWSGMNIEPVEENVLRLKASRPRDINLQIALSDLPGRAQFFVVAGTGLSTLESGIVSSYGDGGGESGFETQTTTVEVQTLAEICRRHAPRDIHFLKIDVEGAERAVLAGADFNAFRPWIVVVEATAPMSTTETYHEWESLLHTAQYRFVWFDGLNRFYLADERHAALSRHFRVPPNIFDDFLRAADTEWARRINQAETGLVHWRERAMETAQRLETEIRAHSDMAQRLALAEARCAAEAAHAQAALASMATLRASTSWRVTQPLRQIAGVLAALRHGPAVPTAALSPPQAEGEAVAAPLALPTPRQAPSGRLTHIVHQFHSGSAYGDAITNAMLLTRRVLRDLGYVSDIFVEHRDPQLTEELRPVDELPQHADYVLIVRHSMGFDIFPRIAALPARKILLYHNITPPEFLASMPVLQRYADLGRQQLALWRPRVAAALADSEYNAIELRSLGFEAVQSCMLLFDIAVLTASAQQPTNRSPREVFTLLFVGRVCESKAQADLLAAYACFQARYAAPCRLVLVGRHGEESDPYLCGLRTRIAERRLQDQVMLTGLVSDAELHRWYHAADLYVSLSHHEGFGVPLVEAIAHGVPVLAWPAGAVPYTLGDPAWLLPDRAPDAVAARILELANAPVLRERLAQQQYASLDRFHLRHQLPRLLEALALAGAAPASHAATRVALETQLHFTITGHINGTYSLAAVNRGLALALEAAQPGAVRVLPVEGIPTKDLSGLPATCRQAIAVLAARPPPVTGPHVVISQHYPVYLPDESGDLLLSMFFWEESIVPPPVIATLNRHFRGVLAPSAFVAKALIDSGLEIPVRSIGLAAELDRFAALRTEQTRPAHPFTFLHVSSCFPRKGIDVLLGAYAAAFRDSENVLLIIKGFPNPHHDLEAQVAQWRERHPDAPAIMAINRDIEEGELHDLYRAADAMVLPTRGEGFNLAAAEAMAAGLPLIVTGFGGQMDFCDANAARLIDYRFAASASHLATPHSLWVEPDPSDLAAALREAYDGQHGGASVSILQRSEVVVSRFGAEALATRVRTAALDILLAPPRMPIRLAWISPWGVRCGVAEYTRHLLENFAPSEAIGSITVLPDDRSARLDATTTGLSVRPAWRLGDAQSLRKLAIAVAAEDPDVVVLQYQPGLFRWSALADLLSDLGSRTITLTLHNTRELCDVESAEQQAALSAMARISRVIVHTIADLNGLKTLGLVANVTMIPHGASQPLPFRAARPLPPDAAPLIGCYGFFLPGKGIAPLIAAVAMLRERWPGLRLRLVNAAYGNADSAIEIAACREAAMLAGLEDAVEWRTGFLPHEQSLALLADCDVIALPYQFSKEASSAALRTALAAGVPVLVTPLPLFDEAGDAVIRLAGIDSAAIAEGLAALLNEVEPRLALQRTARNWLAERQWSEIAQRMQGMLLGLSYQRS